MTGAGRAGRGARSGEGMVLLAVLTAVSALLAGCTSHTVKRVNAVEMIQAQEELAPRKLLDVGIVVFDPGVPDVDPDPKDNVFPQVRRGEARYVPYVLRTTLEETAQWGAVRVLPELDPAAEVQLSGRILASDGFELALEVTARDATGREWFTRVYQDTATQFAYRDDVAYRGDPFQDLYRRIANDLIVFRDSLDATELAAIREVSRLRYAAEIAPDAFDDYLVEDRRGRVSVDRLPAPDDPMLARVDRIREAEYLFVDTVDQQYGVFHARMAPSYDQWRRFSYEETIALRDTKRSARTRMLAGALAVVGGTMINSQTSSAAGSLAGTGAVLGGLMLAKQGFDVGKQADIHEEALKELATSFDAEVAPIVVDVEGEVVKLSGSLEAQYAEWRQIMRRIYAEEVGLPPVGGGGAGTGGA